MELLITEREWRELGMELLGSERHRWATREGERSGKESESSRDIDGKAGRPRERERASQYQAALGIYEYRHRAALHPKPSAARK